MRLPRMTTRRFVGLVILSIAGAVVAVAARPTVGQVGQNSGQPDQYAHSLRQPGPGTQFLRLGRYYINENRLNYVVSQAGGLELIFGGEGQGRLVLDSTLSEAMGRWLDARPSFVRVGPNYINLGRLNYIVNENDTVELIFGADDRDRLVLSGSAAEAMERWLDGRSSGPQLRPGVQNGPRPNSGSQQDSNQQQSNGSNQQPRAGDQRSQRGNYSNPSQSQSNSNSQQGEWPGQRSNPSGSRSSNAGETQPGSGPS